MNRLRREERVFQAVAALAVEKGWGTAQEISGALGLDRGNVSKLLNLLEREGKLCKLPGRPVRFCLPEDAWKFLQPQQEPMPALPFTKIVGQDGSLADQIRQAKAAVLYPPAGLHTILTGPTGTGKTTFAQEMFEYAKHMKILEDGARFIVLNCAEYMKNPQLLVSQLFGHRKGAFTGAENDKIGLVERADGGFLFLDEIHCLPPEGQEMLFTLLDSGVYRRLGETEETRKARVLLIGATTENIEASLLKTFLRRIPVLISFPALAERPAAERLQFIDTFFGSEQEKFSAPLAVHREVVAQLLCYQCPGNVGQLKADIQILCAEAFWKSRNSGQDMVVVDQDSPSLAAKCPVSWTSDLESLGAFGAQTGEWFVWGDETGGPVSRDGYRMDHLSDVIRELHRKQLQGQMSEDRNLFREVHRYLERAEQPGQEPAEGPEDETYQAYLSTSIDLLFDIAQLRLGKTFPPGIKAGMTLYLRERCGVSETATTQIQYQFEKISAQHPKEYSLAKVLQRNLEEVQVALSDQDVAVLTLFLCQDLEQEVPRTGIVVLAHGTSTATSMAAASNEILHCGHCLGLDLPVTMSDGERARALQEITLRADWGAGVLYLIDTAGMEHAVRQVAQTNGIQADVICITSTSVVVEAVRLANQGESLERIASQLRNMISGILCLEARRRENRLPLLLLSCRSDEGQNGNLAQMLQAIAGLADKVDVDLRYVMDGRALSAEEKTRAVAVVGTERVDLEKVPFISIDELIFGDGLRLLRSRLGQESEEEGLGERIGIAPRILGHVLREVLTFLDAEKVRPLILDALLCCHDWWGGRGISQKNLTKLEMRYVIHLACMLERLLRRETLPYGNVETLKDTKSEFFLQARRSVAGIEEFFHFHVPDAEIAYLAEILGSGH